jgi:hypothetical protein
MKWIIYLLLIFNIGFAAWHFRGVDMREDGSVEKLGINNENELVLLSELRQKEKQGEGADSTGARLCYSLGPFTDKTGADEMQAQLKGQGIEIQRVRLRDVSRTGFWVILPASESRKEANKHIARLKELKVKDYFLVATGAHENAISLGVFSQKNLARRRVDEMIRLGFVPSMESVALPRKVYWLNWYKDSGKQPDEALFDSLKQSQPSVSKVERSCP